MGRLNSGKLVIVSVFSIATVLISAYYFLTSNDSPITIQRPTHFGSPIDTGRVTVQGASLGRQLFNDALLSKQQKVSCASCHQQTASYADQGRKLSIGDQGMFTKRNAPVLINMIWKNHFFADGRASRLEETVINAINDTLELNSNLTLILDRVKQHPVYSKKIKSIFKTEEINEIHIVNVLVQYLRTLNSWDSKYDRMLQGSSIFTKNERAGLMLFEKECASCHVPPFFHSTEAAIDGNSYKLLSPSLRNIDHSAPYMQDGRFKNLDSLLLLHPFEFPQAVQKRKLNEEERKSIIIFLKTLSDEHFLNPNSY